MLNYDLSSIECPQCQTNDDLEVIGEHVLEGVTNWSIYDFVCYKCNEVFTQQALIHIKES